jgi:hypothetical protein
VGNKGAIWADETQIVRGTKEAIVDRAIEGHSDEARETLRDRYIRFPCPTLRIEFGLGNVGGQPE